VFVNITIDFARGGRMVTLAQPLRACRVRHAAAGSWILPAGIAFRHVLNRRRDERVLQAPRHQLRGVTSISSDRFTLSFMPPPYGLRA
jgi:hypothetical protein